ncbi:MAG: hypothetical protein N2Z81_06760 [Hydrogenothermaceae bacterium]|nr:hypothetical protein [Hydrogenothermaceae bacterium]
MTKVAWSVTHQEFIISDHYYFSKLQKYAKQNDIVVDEVDQFERFSEYDVIIFNYPEIPFKKEEVDFIEELVKNGKKVGIFAYYKNEDRIADTCNTMSERFGIKFNWDIITDDVNNYDNDNLLITTTKVSEKMKEKGIGKVVLACTDSLTITGNDVMPMIYAEDTAVSKLGKEKILFARYMDPSGGCFIAGGSCVFWDNYSIDLFNNKEFSLALLTHKK